MAEKLYVGSKEDTESVSIKESYEKLDSEISSKCVNQNPNI